jgi:hypothetical protein
MFAPEGWVAQDLDSEMLLSEATYDDRPNNLTSAVTSIGDYGYEAAMSAAATAQDLDTSYLVGRIMRGALYAKYRDSSSDSRPKMMSVYDFSAGIESNGLAALKRPDGSAWGWSTECYTGSEAIGGYFSAMCEARRDDGPHLYGWNDANSGSGGDGRIDEFETGSTDNGTAIATTLPTPPLQFGEDQVSAQAAIVEHATPTGAVVNLVLTRSLLTSGDPYTLTLSANSQSLIKDRKEFSTAARSPTDAVTLDVRQVSGSATEVRGILLLAKRVPKFRPA